MNNLHKLYEANLEGYQRRHLVPVTAFFRELMEGTRTKPLKWALANLQKLARFVCIDWLGEEEVRLTGPKIKGQEEVTLKEDFGRCGCGGFLVKRQNRIKKNFFLACSQYPKCKYTQPL